MSNAFRPFSQNLEMKKYYLHDGANQEGPFDIEDLRARKISKETAIWFEGLPAWTTAGEIDELDVLFNVATPPPFNSNASGPPPQNPSADNTSDNPKAAPHKKNKLGVVLQSIGALGALIIIIMIIMGYLRNSDVPQPKKDSSTYQEKVMTVEEIERAQPAKFLSAGGTYNENFWGDMLKVHGKIKNNATVASFKDAVVKITYYSKTKTELGSKEYIIYENFPPHSEVAFELKIDNYKDVNSIGWTVINATAN